MAMNKRDAYDALSLCCAPLLIPVHYSIATNLEAASTGDAAKDSMDIGDTQGMTANTALAGARACRADGGREEISGLCGGILKNRKMRKKRWER